MVKLDDTTDDQLANAGWFDAQALKAPARGLPERVTSTMTEVAQVYGVTLSAAFQHLAENMRTLHRSRS